MVIQSVLVFLFIMVCIHIVSISEVFIFGGVGVGVRGFLPFSHESALAVAYLIRK